MTLAASLGSSTQGPVHKMPSNATLGAEDDNVTFDSPEEEARHYRERYRRIMDMLDETRAELDEFQASSKELEDELERELADTEKQQAELKEKIKRLEAEKEDWKNKHTALQKMHSSTTSAMQREMDNLRSERDKTLVALRDLEMGNDELERNERVAVSSLLDLESKYNRAIEEKTLLEQEVITGQELEAECQRLKDDVRDANNEIAILREQLSRAVPTPPSSISMPLSPMQEPVLDLSHIEVSLDNEDDNKDDDRDDMPLSAFERSLPPPPPLPKSSTMSSIPTFASPISKRPSTYFPHSPSGIPGLLSRSSNTRNLAAAAAAGTGSGIPPPSPSPALRKSTSTRFPAPSPARVVSANTAKSKGFKLLYELQARLKATDDKLGTKVPKRNVSNPMALAAGLTRRHLSTSTTATTASQLSQKASHARISELAQSQSQNQDHRHISSTPTNPASDKSSVLSPNGWVLVEDDMTPINQMSGRIPEEPQSPLMPSHQRAASAATNKSTGGRTLPTRPGIPSPLASMYALSKSTSTASKLSHSGDDTTANGKAQSDVRTQARANGTPTMSRSSTVSGANSGGSARRTPLAQSVRPGSSSGTGAIRGTTQSTSSSRPTRPQSRQDTFPAANSSVASAAANARPSSRAGTSRPLSPSSIARPSSSLMQHISPYPGSASSSSATANARPPSRTSSRQGQHPHAGLGRGPPPSAPSSNSGSRAFPSSSYATSSSQSNTHAQTQASGHRSNNLFSSTSILPLPSTPPISGSGLRRPSRRSSVGGESPGALRPTGLPVPTPPGRIPSMGKSASRPASVPVFNGTPPPPVPRIPSVHLKDSKRGHAPGSVSVSGSGVDGAGAGAGAGAEHRRNTSVAVSTRS